MRAVCAPACRCLADLSARRVASERSLLDSQWRSDVLSEPLSAGERLAKLTVEGRFVDVLRSSDVAALDLFRFADGQLATASDSCSDQLTLLSIAVALVHAFAQVNWTGPELGLGAAELVRGDKVDGQALNAAAVRALGFGGEPAYHLARQAALLAWALDILGTLDTTRPAESHWTLPSVMAWRLRAGLVRIGVLEDAVTLPSWILDDAHAFADTDVAADADILAAHTLLRGHYFAAVSNAQPSANKMASETFHRAAADAQLEYELTGRLGRRTKFQTFDRSQLVVLARGRERAGWVARKQLSPTEPATAEASSEPKALALNDDTLLERTAFTSSPATTQHATALSSLDPSAQPPLHPLDESILLGLSLNVRNTSPAHGLTTLQIGAFVQRVLDDGSQNWSVYTMALLLRSRLEATRTRTVERGLLQIQSLVDQLKFEADPGRAVEQPLREMGADARERLALFHVLALPTRWALERELATRYLGLGVVRSALEIYERLEMWDDAARCWAQSGRRDKAIALVRDLLEGTRTESDALMTARGRPGGVKDPQRLAKLWCLLGELENEPNHFRTAWKVSGERSAKAMRSLGGTLFSAGEFAEARDCLRRSVRIAPLDLRAWFLLGCAALHVEDWPVAEEAFGRVVAIDDEDGESWSNLASVHLRMTNAEPAAADVAAADDDEAIASAKVPMDRKRAAFACLKQAVRRSRDSWRIWQNYMVVAVDVGELEEACRALGRLVELRAEREGEQAVDLDVLDRLVAAATRADPSPDASRDPAQLAVQGLPGRVRHLIETGILPRLSSIPRVYLAHARLQLWSGDAAGALESHLRAYRCGPGGPNDGACETDRTPFVEATEAVRDVVDALRNLGPRAGKTDWAFQARSILRSFLGRTRSSFEDEPQWTALQDEAAELRSVK